MPSKTVDSLGDDESSYYCPIHPETLREKPGTCSKCRMPLVRNASGEEWKGNDLL
jgi:hypothetical protein